MLVRTTVLGLRRTLMVTNSLVYIQLWEAPTNRTYYRPSRATCYETDLLLRTYLL
uniref:Uncharacterized protein n=1 Tax=Helianthus annuus TaxID=4232 RepID=A0A251VBT1_HELAN